MQDENCGEKMISGVDQPQVAAEISTVTDETDADKQERKAHIWPKSKNKFFYCNPNKIHTNHEDHRPSFLI
jgi:hypothetical protein